jgi:hypothetical protein
LWGDLVLDTLVVGGIVGNPSLIQLRKGFHQVEGCSFVESTVRNWTSFDSKKGDRQASIGIHGHFPEPDPMASRALNEF